MSAKKALAALVALCSSACTCARLAPGLEFPCEPDRSCPDGLTCQSDGYCRAGAEADAGRDAGEDAGLDGGSDAGADAGSTDAGSTDAGPPRACLNGFCWESPLPQGNTLRAAVALSPTDVWMVGDHGAIVHTERGGFVLYDSGTTRGLRAVFAVAPNDLYAVGERAVITHWDGVRWTLESTKEEKEALVAVWASRTTALAVGESGFALERDSTGQWQEVVTQTSANFVALWQVAGGDVWAVTDGDGAFRYKSLGFEVVPAGEWPFDGRAVTAVTTRGARTFVAGTFGAVMVREADGGWDTFADGGFYADETPHALCAASERDVWLLSVSATAPQAQQLRHLPTRASLPPGEPVFACAALDVGRAVVGGNRGYWAEAGADAGLAVRSLRTTQPPRYQALFAAADHPASLVAAGDRGVAAARTDGGDWVDRVACDGTQQLWDGWAGSENDRWVVGSAADGGPIGCASQWNGAQWTPSLAPVLYSVFGLAGGETFFGSRGAIFVWKTSQLSLDYADAGDSAQLLGLWVAADRFPWTAVGTQGRVMQRQPDSSWRGAGVGDPAQTYRAIHGAVLADGGVDVWVVGAADGGALRFAGGGWQTVAFGAGSEAFRAVFAESERTWVGGEQGRLWRRDGAGWALLQTPAGGSITGLWVQPDGGGLWLADDEGALLSRVPVR